MQIVEVLADIGDAYKAGQIVELKDDAARSLIAIGQAKESDAGSLLRQSNRADMDKFKADLLGEIRTALKPPGGNGHKPAPPNGGGAIDFNPTGASTPAEEQDKRRCLADAMRCIFLVNAMGVDPQLHDFARRRLRGYSDEFTEYKLNEDTGSMDVTITRALANGGLETIQRTGTDSISGGATYGFTLKPEFLGTLFSFAREQEVFASAAEKIPVAGGNEVRWPALGQYSAPVNKNGVMQSAVFGGITVGYKGEVTQRDASDATGELIDFKIVDLTGFTRYSRDYIVDNYIAMDSIVTRLFAQAIAWVEDWVCIQGDGVGKPQGFFNSPAVLTQNRGTASHIEYEDLVGMWAKMFSMCWGGARWIANPTTIPELAAIKNHAGNYVYNPNALVVQSQAQSIRDGSTASREMTAPRGMLLGWPIYFSEKVPALGTKGDLSLVCPDQYGLAERAGLEVGVSEHFYFDTDRIAYRFKKRHDGRSLWRAPYIQADNTTTPGSGTKVSPFVVLN